MAPAKPMTGTRHQLSDWELWACARQQVAEHGDAAPEAAALRADELLAAGDLAGNAAWIDILVRIGQLATIDPDETSH